MPKTIIWIDTETTGKNTATDRIIQLSLIKTIGLYELVEKKKLYFNNCSIPIHPEAIKAHGITENMIKTCHPFSAYALTIFKYLEDCDIIGGFNSKMFDIPIIAEEFARAGINWKPKSQIDTSVIFKKQEQRNLSAALKFYCGEELDGAHDAENDVMATIKVAQGQVFRYGFDNFVYQSFDNLKDNSTITEVPVEDVLISESFYENEKEKIDFHNKIILGTGEFSEIPVWNFGKYRDKNIPIKQDLSYCDWVLKLNDFPGTTKNLIRKILCQNV